MFHLTNVRLLWVIVIFWDSVTVITPNANFWDCTTITFTEQYNLFKFFITHVDLFQGGTNRQWDVREEG